MQQKRGSLAEGGWAEEGEVFPCFNKWKYFGSEAQGGIRIDGCADFYEFPPFPFSQPQVSVEELENISLPSHLDVDGLPDVSKWCIYNDSAYDYVAQAEYNAREFPDKQPKWGFCFEVNVTSPRNLIQKQQVLFESNGGEEEPISNAFTGTVASLVLLLVGITLMALQIAQRVRVENGSKRKPSRELTKRQKTKGIKRKRETRTKTVRFEIENELSGHSVKDNEVSEISNS